jgi:transcriptional regulator with XRE-family HTH domain
VARETGESFGQRLRRHRRERRLTQEELDERSGISARAISDLERGGVEPRVATVAALADALALSAEDRVAFEAAADEARRPRTGAARVDNLPYVASEIIGREQEAAEVRRLLDRHRIVTLTGAGGVGKTRLAVEVARDLSGTYSDGVWLVELAALDDPDLVPGAVAVAADIEPDRARRPAAALADALRPWRTVIVLDNCEHLVETCALLAEELLRECPNVRLMATSREPLGCDGEAVFRVPSLALPPEGRLSSPAEIGAAAAVRLFVERAAEVAPGFGLTSRNAAAIAEVCRRLDGIPLALEFAARLVRALSVEEIAVRLDDRFRLLTGWRRTAMPRQQTLRAVVDWSYELLSPAERRLFARLSVFPAGSPCRRPRRSGGARNREWPRCFRCSSALWTPRSSSPRIAPSTVARPTHLASASWRRCGSTAVSAWRPPVPWKQSRSGAGTSSTHLDWSRPPRPGARAAIRPGHSVCQRESGRTCGRPSAGPATRMTRRRPADSPRRWGVSPVCWAIRPPATP